MDEPESSRHKEVNIEIDDQFAPDGKDDVVDVKEGSIGHTKRTCKKLASSTQRDVAVREQRAASATAVGSIVDDSSPPDIVLPKDKVEPLGLHIQHIPMEEAFFGPDMNSSPIETEFPSEDKIKMGPSVEHQFIPSFNGWSPHQNNKQDRSDLENLSAGELPR
ncbi:Protein NARROW LEAF 1 [Camellia lanceoleosa]|uniref:Protein NARROW LEAF 1 n=1 Tax=Camellia lanceoleosa TaxID=1840588 RepID=A0ACC0FMJ7_9ERIC|nr:Protein NARROW LEAF 1 [Camellia lanceoleosa]